MLEISTQARPFAGLPVLRHAGGRWVLTASGSAPAAPARPATAPTTAKHR